MGSYAPLTAGLQHVSPLEELEPGDTFVIRFKNSARDYKTDLWIAVLLPNVFEAMPGLHRRPKDARPVLGEWTTDRDKRIYPVYLPGRNLYRWVPISDFFVIGNKLPRIFAGERDHTMDAKIYRELLKLVGKKPGLGFWQSMAKKESLVKGKRVQKLGLVRPDGFDEVMEDITTCGPEDFDKDGKDAPRDAESPNDAARLDGEPFPKVQRVTSSFSASRNLRDSSNSKEKVPEQKLLTFPGENPSSKVNLLGQSSWQIESGIDRIELRCTEPMTPFQTQDKVPKSEEEPIEDISYALFDKHKKIFEESWTLATMIEHILLHKEHSQEMLAVFRDIATVQEPELGKLVSFLRTQEFSPQLLKSPRSVEASAQESKESEIGDCLGIQREFQLQGVTDMADLHDQIAELGKLYSYARRLHMIDLVGKIMIKLQTSWNSYPGLSQLEPLLNVADLSFRDSTWTDHVQDWLIKFIADSMDLIFYQCPHRYWALMKDRPALFSSVIKTRSELNRKDPDRYANPRDQLRKRGIEEL